MLFGSIILIILYSLIVFVIYHYKKQKQKEARKNLLKNIKIKKYFKDKKNIDLDNNKQKITKKDKKKK